MMGCLVLSVKSDGVLVNTASSAFSTSRLLSPQPSLAKPREGTCRNHQKETTEKHKEREGCRTYQSVMIRLTMIIGGKFGDKTSRSTAGSDDAAMRRG